MPAERLQTTIAAPCSVTGRGYWTGQANTLTFLPAPADSGINFLRTDLEGHPSVPAVAEKRCGMQLRTRLVQGRAEVDMVEHVMAALSGLQIDNCRIHCTAAEMPAMDGSSLAFALALQSVGNITLTSPRTTLWIDRSLRVGDDQQWIIAQPHTDPSGTRAQTCQLEYHLNFGPDSPIHQSHCRIDLSPCSFVDTLAAARTFIDVATARMLQSKGMATHVTEQDLLVFDEHGPVNNRLRYPDECARHKLLDLVGDLALSGVDLVGRIVAHRSGHLLNGQMAEALRNLAIQPARSADLHRAA